MHEPVPLEEIEGGSYQNDVYGWSQSLEEKIEGWSWIPFGNQRQLKITERGGMFAYLIHRIEKNYGQCDLGNNGSQQFDAS